VFPAVRTIALVEFSNPSSAKAAFRKLAYKKFMHVPLFLEWAPSDIFGEEDAGAVTAPSAKHRASKDAPAGEAVDGAQDDNDSDTESLSLFVKNLNFDTTNETLEAAFKRRVNGVRSAKVCDHALSRIRLLSPDRSRIVIALCSPPDRHENGQSARRFKHGLWFC